MSRLALASLFVAALLTPASAQWISQSQGGAFDDDPLHIAITAKGSYGFGLRCRGMTTEVVFVTPEDASEKDTLKFMNAVNPKIRVRIDRGDIIELDASLDGVDDKLGVVADVDADFFKKVRDAKSSVDVVLTLLGKNFHETTFNVRGSRSAVSKIIKGCKLD